MAKPATVADPNTIMSAPRVINVDKYAPYPKAIAALKAAGILPEAVELRQVKYLNNLVEQDHLLSSDWSSQGWASFPSRWHGERVPGIRGHEYD